MSCQKKYFIKVFTTIVFIAIVIGSFSQSIVTQKVIVKTELTVLDNNKLHVKVFNPKVNSENLTYSFINKTPNYHLELDILKNINKFKIHYKDEKFVSCISLENIVVNSEFEYLEYEITLTTVDNETFLPVSSYTKKEDYSIFNFSSILGSFKEIDETVDLRIISNNILILLINEKYDLLIERPLALNFHELSIKSSFPLYIKVNNNTIIDNITLETYIEEALKTIKEIEKFNNSDLIITKNQSNPYIYMEEIRKMIFIFDSISSNTGAIAHEENIVFHFNSNDKFLIQKTIIHELLHWILPDQKSWINESFAEYLALKIMLKNKLISERGFFDKMSKKLKLADKYNEYSLKEIYKDNKKYEALYTKGAFYAWMLDILVLKNTNFENGILEYIVSPNLILAADKEKIVIDLIKFETEFIDNNKYISPNNYLRNIGVLFEQNKLKEIKPKQTIVFKNLNNKLVIEDIGNIGEFQKNDVLISIDKKRKISRIKKKLYSMSKKESRFLILRNGEKIKIRLNNKKSIMRKYKYYISFSDAKTSLHKQNWENYINNL